jgi:hypothetical protein
LVFGVAEKAQLTWSRALKRGQFINGRLWTTVKAAA